MRDANLTLVHGGMQKYVFTTHLDFGRFLELVAHLVVEDDIRLHLQVQTTDSIHNVDYVSDRRLKQ